MANTKEISRRIRSIGNTKKITKAMEMVSAAKMRKAIEAVLKTRTYANLSWETILNLAKLAPDGEERNPLLQTRSEIKKVALILITSNRSLCGGFNMTIINKAKESIIKHNHPTDLILIGTKGEILGRHYPTAAIFPKGDLSVNSKETNPIAKMVIADFLSGKYDKVLVAYTDFVSPAKQIPRVKQLLPIGIETQDEFLGIVGASDNVPTSKEYIETKAKKHLETDDFTYEYTFEPSPAEVLEKVLPKLIQVQLYQALLESNAAEHSARMAAMHQANEAAADMVSELVLYYNKARQAAITAEIAEISAGANALND